MRRGYGLAAGAMPVVVGLLLSACAGPVDPAALTMPVYASPGKVISDDIKAGTKFGAHQSEDYHSNAGANTRTYYTHNITVQPNASGAADLGIDGNVYSFAASDYSGTPKMLSKTFPNGDVVTLASYLRDTKDVFDGVAPSGSDYQYLDAEQFTASASSGYTNGSFVFGQETPVASYPKGSATYNGSFRINIIDKVGASPSEYVLTGGTTAGIDFDKVTTNVALNASHIQKLGGSTNTVTGSLSGLGVLNTPVTLKPDSNFTTNIGFKGASAFLDGRLYGPAAEEFGGAISFTSNDCVGNGYAVAKR